MTHINVLNAAAAGMRARRRTRWEKLVCAGAHLLQPCQLDADIECILPCGGHVLGAPCGARTEQARGHVRGASLPSVSDTLGAYEG